MFGGRFGLDTPVIGNGASPFSTIIVFVLILAAGVLLFPRQSCSCRGPEARLAASKTDITTLGFALDAFQRDTGRYPTTQEGLFGLVEPVTGLENWRGPYIARGQIPVDPWGRPYVYLFPGIHNPLGFDLSSYGEDGRESKDDIGNWPQ